MFEFKFQNLKLEFEMKKEEKLLSPHLLRDTWRIHICRHENPLFFFW